MPIAPLSVAMLWQYSRNEDLWPFQRPDSCELFGFSQFGGLKSYCHICKHWPKTKRRSSLTCEFCLSHILQQQNVNSPLWNLLGTTQLLNHVTIIVLCCDRQSAVHLQSGQLHRARQCDHLNRFYVNADQLVRGVDANQISNGIGSDTDGTIGIFGM